jgi:hypothetical protein
VLEYGFGISQYHLEKVVEIVSNTPSQSPDCFHFLGLYKLYLQFHILGHIVGYIDKTYDLARGITNGEIATSS